MSGNGPTGTECATGSPRVSLIVALLLGVLAASVWGRACHETAHYAALGETAERESRWDDAIVHYRHSAQWFAPLSSQPRASVDALVALGDQAEGAGDDATALAAWRSARIAILSTRWLATPHAEVLDALHPRIAAAMERQAGTPGAAERFEAQLDAWPEREPNRGLALLASLAFCAWIGALVGAAWFGFDREGRLRRAALLRWTAAWLALSAVWMLCTRFA